MTGQLKHLKSLSQDSVNYTHHFIQMGRPSPSPQLKCLHLWSPLSLFNEFLGSSEETQVYELMSYILQNSYLEKCTNSFDWLRIWPCRCPVLVPKILWSLSQSCLSTLHSGSLFWHPAMSLQQSPSPPQFGQHCFTDWDRGPCLKTPFTDWKHGWENPNQNH